MVIHIDDNYDAMCQRAAERVAQVIKWHQFSDKPAVLGLPTGNTPIGMYEKLVKMHEEQGLDFSNVVTFNLDEYWPISHDNPKSFHAYMNEHFFSKVNIKPENIHMLSGEVTKGDVEAHCQAYEQAIQDVGGLDLVVLGIGRNGHIAFNEPGSKLDSRTRKVMLDSSTSTANDVPTFHSALTMGISTIMGAKELLLMASGKDKNYAVENSVRPNTYSAKYPATALRLHDQVSYCLDEAAASANVQHRVRQQQNQK